MDWETSTLAFKAIGLEILEKKPKRLDLLTANLIPENDRSRKAAQANRHGKHGIFGDFAAQHDESQRVATIAEIESIAKH